MSTSRSSTGGQEGFRRHECIVDLRKVKGTGHRGDDVAKRLMDYGFHAPTTSFPVIGTLMIEPPRATAKAEADRSGGDDRNSREIREIESGRAPGRTTSSGRADTAGC